MKMWLLIPLLSATLNNFASGQTIYRVGVDAHSEIADILAFYKSSMVKRNFPISYQILMKDIEQLGSPETRTPALIRKLQLAKVYLIPMEIELLSQNPTGYAEHQYPAQIMIDWWIRNTKELPSAIEPIQVAAPLR